MPNRIWLMTLTMVASASMTTARADDPPADVTGPPAYEEFLVIPLRVHVLISDELPEADCKLNDDDVRRIVGKVNGIWHVAGIHFGLESIVREPAAEVRRFRLARDLGGAGADEADAPRRPRAPLGLYRLLVPDGPSRHFDGLHVYFLHAFPVNGVYMGGDFAMVQETARLREVEGGIDEPLPRVTAHELGHALGLSHRQDRTNLLASGTTGTLLNAAEVATARERALTWKGALPVAKLREAAESAEEAAVARRLWSWLAEVPGDGAEEARRRLGDLDDPS